MTRLKLIKWQACNKLGELVSGLLVAKNKTQAQQILTQRSLIPVRVHYQYFSLISLWPQPLPPFFLRN